MNFNFNINQILIMLVKMMFLNFFKQFMFYVIKKLEKNYKLDNLYDLFFYAGMLYEKVSCLLNKYLMI